MTEEWMSVAGFPDYEVSSLGQARRITVGRRGSKPRILTPWNNRKGPLGYLIIGLTLDGAVYKKLVHRLVCEAFHGPAPERKGHAAHNDGNSLNNCFENLRWVDRSENMEDARRHGTMAMGAKHGRTTKPEKTPRGVIHGHAKLSEEDVMEIRSAPKLKGSGRALARRFGVSPATICIIRSGKIWTHLPLSTGS